MTNIPTKQSLALEYFNAIIHTDPTYREVSRSAWDSPMAVVA